MRYSDAIKLRFGLRSRHWAATAATAAHGDKSRFQGRFCLLVEDEPLDEVESRDRIFDRRVPSRVTLDVPSEMLFRPIMIDDELRRFPLGGIYQRSSQITQRSAVRQATGVGEERGGVDDALMHEAQHA